MGEAEELIIQKLFSVIPVLVVVALFGKFYFTETVIEMDSLKEIKGTLLKQGVNPERCLTWAFGEDWDKVEIKRLNDIWKSRHPESFTFYSTDEKHAVFNRIAQACKGV